MHCNSLYSLSRHYINSLEVYNPPPSPKKECSDLKGTISSRYLLSFIVAPWIASLGPSGACGRAVWRLLGGPGDPLGGLWGRSWGGPPLTSSWGCQGRRSDGPPPVVAPATTPQRSYSFEDPPIFCETTPRGLRWRRRASQKRP